MVTSLHLRNRIPHHTEKVNNRVSIPKYCRKVLYKEWRKEVRQIKVTRTGVAELVDLVLNTIGADIGYFSSSGYTVHFRFDSKCFPTTTVLMGRV